MSSGKGVTQMLLRPRFWIVAFVVMGVAAAVPAAAGEEDVVALFKIKGPLTEAPDAFGLGQMLGDAAPVNMFDLLKKLHQARADDNVKAVIFDIQEATLGFAQIQELRVQFEALRAAGKDVLVFCEFLGNGTLLLGSAADQLTLMPTGLVAFTGLYGEGLYFKNLMDKVGLEADIIHCGAYKSAGEPFYRSGPSPEAEEQTNWLLDSIFEQILEGVADSRGLNPKKVRELVNGGLLSAKAALDAKLVDKLQYREDFIKGVKKRYGEDTKVVANYGKKDELDIDFDNPFAIFKLLGDLMKGKEKSDKAAIGIVYVVGPITSGESEPSLFGGSSNAGSTTIRRAIAEAAADESVKALILRVDSPGGSAIASEVICEASKRFKDSGRPFIVSMGNVAGSGGYYVATLGDTIFAEPGTITGSIGVVGGKIVTKGLWDWVGVTGHEYKRGKFSDMMNTNRRFGDDERELLESFLYRVYDEFKGRVMEGRADRIKGELEPLAGGRVYTGKQALEIGLVDRLGGFADAIKYTAAEAELGTDYELRVYPRPKTFFDIIAEALGGQKKDDEFVSSTAGLGTSVGSQYAKLPAMAAALEALQTVDPAKAAKLREFLIQLQLLSAENVLLVGPDFNTVLR
ncbi:MAG: signal peptide peptidase SppA [Phycisphaerae bacterium]|nr:signal peptide peptidase SppA [Phycisphaerae bacterium]